MLATVLVASIARANNDEKYLQLASLQRMTSVFVQEIKIYTNSFQQKQEFFKDNCLKNLIKENYNSCMTTAIVMKKIALTADARMDFFDEYVAKEYPAEFSVVREGIKKITLKNKAKIAEVIKQSEMAYVNLQKMSAEHYKKMFAELAQQGILAGNRAITCMSFDTWITTLDLQYRNEVFELSKFAKFFKSQKFIEDKIEMAKLFESQCAAKLDIKNAENLLKRFKRILTTNIKGQYIVSRCNLLSEKDSDLKRKCFMKGRKNEDLLYSLIQLEGN